MIRIQRIDVIKRLLKMNIVFVWKSRDQVRMQIDIICFSQLLHIIEDPTVIRSSVDRFHRRFMGALDPDLQLDKSRAKGG